MKGLLIDTTIFLKKQLQRFINEEFKEYNLKSAEILFMQILFQKGEKSQIEMTRLLDCDKAHTQRIVTKLIEKKLIYYIDKDHEHLKNQKLALTPEGKLISIKSEIFLKVWNSKLVEGIDEKDLVVAREVIRKIIDNANKIKNLKDNGE